MMSSVGSQLPVHQQQQPCAVAIIASVYDDVFTEVGDGPAPMLVFPQAPMSQPSDRHHIEIGAGSPSLQSETTMEALPGRSSAGNNNLASLMAWYTETLHVHDVSTCSSAMPAAPWFWLRWCRVERCPSLHSVSPPGAIDYGRLETIWASDLLMARCVWSKGGHYDYDHFRGLQHLHLRRCPSLRVAIATGNRPSLPRLETLHIIHCGDLRHVFVPGGEDYWHHTSSTVSFPKLTITIHLHDLPALQQICKGADQTPAPALETIRIRGCWSLRRLPALMGREPGMRKPAVEVEKDVWDALEWDGVDAGHHPSLYDTPVHSRYYKQSRMLRGTVLR